MATPATIVGAFIAVTLALVTALGWLMRQTFTTTIPGIQADAAKQREILEKELDKARDKHDVVIKEICDTFKAEMGAERQMTQEMADKGHKISEERSAVFNTSLLGLTTAIAQGQQAVIAQVTKHTTDAVTQYRHDLANTIQEAVLGREIWLLKKKEIVSQGNEEKAV